MLYHSTPTSQIKQSKESDPSLVSALAWHEDKKEKKLILLPFLKDLVEHNERKVFSTIQVWQPLCISSPDKVECLCSALRS